MLRTSPQPRGHRILVVDDEPHIRRILNVLLTQAGYDVAECSTGPEALQQIPEGGFDLIVLDLVLPGLDGLQLLAAVRSHPDTARTPVIVLTAKGQDADRETAIGGGADAFLTKPFSPMRLLAHIREILDSDG